MKNPASLRRPILLFLPLFVAALGAAPADEPAPAAPATPAASSAQEPGTAPDIAWSDLQGAPHRLDELAGRVVLLEFWASWCAPCRQGVPFLDRLQAGHDAEGLTVLAISLETDDEAVSRFVAEHPGRFLTGRDPSGRAGEILEVAAMPTAILLDRQGRPVARFEGGSQSVHEAIEQAVVAALSGGPVQAAGSKRRRSAAGSLKAWQRGYLADPIMNLDGDPLTRAMREHIHASKEGAAGDGGVAGGGCGCN